RVWVEPAIRARTVPDGRALQITGDRLQLPARDQAVLHACERRRQNRDRHGCPGAGHWRSHWRRATGRAPGPTAGEPEIPQAQAGGLLVVCGLATLRHRATRGFWPRLRTAVNV